MINQFPFIWYHFAFCVSVPQKVSELKVDSMGWLRCLKVSWLPPTGDWDKYRILLFDRSTLLLNITLEKDKREYIIKDLALIPGRKYEVVIAVESGGLQNKAHCKGRTGEKTVCLGWVFSYYSQQKC